LELIGIIIFLSIVWFFIMVIFPQPCHKASRFYNEYICNFLTFKRQQKLDKNINNHQDFETNDFNKNVKDYPKCKNKLNEECFNFIVNNLFFNNDDLDILRKLFRKPIIEEDLKKHQDSISLNDYNISLEKYYIGPRCLDGSIDMRYNGSFSNKYTTVFTMRRGKENIKESFQKNISKERIEQAIDKYNFYIYAMKNQQLVSLYTSLLDINNECNRNRNRLLDYMSEHEKSTIIYNELSNHITAFSQEEHENFIELKENIDNKEKEIEDLNKVVYTEEFEKLHKKFLNVSNDIKKKKDAIDERNHISNLFKEIE